MTRRSGERLPWHKKVSAALFWSSENICPIASLPVYAFFSKEEKLTLNHAMSLRVLEQIAFMETFGLAVVAKSVSRSLLPVLSLDEIERVRRMWLEESLHVYLFRRLIDATRSSLGERFKPTPRSHAWVKRLAGWVTLFPAKWYVLSWLHLSLYLEELEFHYSKASRNDESIDPLHREVLWYHAKDESTHIATNVMMIQKLIETLPSWIVWLNQAAFVFVLTRVFFGFQSNWRDWNYWVGAAPELSKYSDCVKRELRELVRTPGFLSGRLNRRILPQTFGLLEKTGYLSSQELTRAFG